MPLRRALSVFRTPNVFALDAPFLLTQVREDGLRLDWELLRHLAQLCHNVEQVCACEYISMPTFGIFK